VFGFRERRRISEAEQSSEKHLMHLTFRGGGIFACTYLVLQWDRKWKSLSHVTHRSVVISVSD